MEIKKIVAIGGWENWMVKTNWEKVPYETEWIDSEIVKLTGKENPNFLFLGHWVNLEYQEWYFRTMEKIYWEKFWCECKDLKSNELSNIEKARQLVEWADIIYEWWWSTVNVVESRQTSWFDKILEDAWKKWKVMCGLSAWGNCWFKECSSDSMKIKYGDNHNFIKVDCLWFADWLFVPHCDESGRQEHAKQLLKKESNEIWLLFSNCAALEILDDEYRVLTTKTSKELNRPMEKGYWKKTYRNNDEYKEEILDDSPEFKKLSELYSKL